ncbi:hypothetical protein K7432_000640 [Basidiobolus ranarum]|uniref:Small nuclear ribonucleoprotein E n=1 Tax=Basidiobolus ranarum TaxID=34480 RepID=A0ABR2X4K0_9FUNG
MYNKVQKIMVQPINLIFRYLQNRSKVQIWLYEQLDMRIEGRIVGFDEFMNLVLDEAEEVNSKKKTRRALGMLIYIFILRTLLTVYLCRPHST